MISSITSSSKRNSNTSAGDHCFSWYVGGSTATGGSLCKSLRVHCLTVFLLWLLLFFVGGSVVSKADVSSSTQLAFTGWWRTNSADAFSCFPDKWFRLVGWSSSPESSSEIDPESWGGSQCRCQPTRYHQDDLLDKLRLHWHSTWKQRSNK